MSARKKTDDRSRSPLAASARTDPVHSRRLALLLAALLALTLALAPRAEAYVYWANAASTETGGARIGRANLDGTGVNQSFVTGAGVLFGPEGVAVDAAHVYWTDFARGTIGRANLDGTGVDQSFITGAGTELCLGGVAVDAGHVYWTNSDAGTIGRANLDGTGVDQGFITGAAGPQGVAVDRKHLYWANFNRIARASLDGTGVDKRFVTGAGNALGVAVDALRSFSFGKAKPNKKKGTARLTVKVPRPGDLELANTTQVKGAKTRAEAKGKAKLPVRPRGKGKRKLKAKGKAKVKAEVTYTPRGGNPTVVGNTDTKTVKLIKR
jgi:hypothetical protein